MCLILCEPVIGLYRSVDWFYPLKLTLGFSPSPLWLNGTMDARVHFTMVHNGLKMLCSYSLSSVAAFIVDFCVVTKYIL